MMRRLALIAVLSLVLTMGLAGGAKAVNFEPADLAGTWHMSAWGMYDVHSRMYYGTFVIDEFGSITHGSGAEGWTTDVQWAGGRLFIDGTGNIEGSLAGSGSAGALLITFQWGQMDLAKDTITGNVHDDGSSQMMLIMTKAN